MLRGCIACDPVKVTNKFWLQKWDEAANAYQNFYLSFPKHERVPNAMFQKAVCLFRKGAYDEAVADFKTFPEQFRNQLAR